jgi:hypothetical protein
MPTLSNYIHNNKNKIISSLTLGKLLPSEYMFQGMTTNEMYGILYQYSLDNGLHGFSIQNIKIYTIRLKKIKAIKPVRTINRTLHYYSLGQMEEFVKIAHESALVKVPFYKYALVKFYIVGHLGYLTHPETDPDYKPELLDGIIHEIAIKSKADRKLKSLQHFGMRALSERNKWEKEYEQNPSDEIKKKLEASIKRHNTITKKIDAYSALLTEQSVKYVI